MIRLGVMLGLFVQPALPAHIAPLIAEARSVARAQGDNIWPGFARTPFPVLFVGKMNSYLFCPAGPAKGFMALSTDIFTKCTVKIRKRTYALDLQATFPAVDGISTVVIGAPSRTDGNNAAWISTLLHEHFHQMQMEEADYYKTVKALDLSGSEEGGMWMLNFPFPYKNLEVAKAFQTMAHTLAGALQTDNETDFHTQINQYRVARRAAFATVSVKEARYCEFQLWQEGVARYSEIAIAEAAVERSRRRESPYDYSALAVNLRVRVLDNLARFNMVKNQRVSFYALGAGEALLLDRLSPNWRERYFHTGMAMGPLVYETN